MIRPIIAALSLSMFFCVPALANEELPITVEPSGAHTVGCEIYGMKLRFGMSADTVEARVALPDASFMLRNGFIKPKDILSAPGKNQLASGDVVELHDLKIGSRSLRKVKALVSDTMTVPLWLGQKALNRLGTHSVYGNRFVIVDAKKHKERRDDAKIDRGKYFNDRGEEVKPNYSGEGMREYNGATYRGVFKKGVLSGFGTITYASGDVYEGEIADDKPNGAGRFAWLNGDRYQGQFVDGKKHGEGILEYADGSRYEGAYENDVRSGFGMIIWPDGERYEGNFAGGKRQGEGRFLWANGDEYDGEWVNNRREGHGILKSREGGWTYEGDFRRSRREGQGRVVWDSGDIYKGEFKDDQRTGRGTMWLENGDRYEGDFVDGYFYGQGTYYYQDGNSYEGGWIDDMREGHGKFRFADGTWYTGTWHEDRLVDSLEESTPRR